MKRCVLAVWSFLFVSQSIAQPTADAWIEPLTSMPFVKVGTGCYRMGTDVTPFRLGSQALREVGYTADSAADEKPQHEVCLTAFWIGRYEVRAEEWLRVMQTAPPGGGGQEPASGITWRAAVEFAERLTAQSTDKSIYRLPTEAEWEIACLAASPQEKSKKQPGRAASGQVPESLELFSGHMAVKPRVAGSMKPNGWGLHDMLGNVWEWVQDVYDPAAYKRHGLYDPVRTGPAGPRVIRGGSHRSESHHLRCANRGAYAEADALPTIGFRLVRQERP